MLRIQFLLGGMQASHTSGHANISAVTYAEFLRAYAHTHFKLEKENRRLNPFRETSVYLQS